MDIEKRLSNLENMVCALSNKVDRIKFYTDSDVESHNVRITANTEEDSALEDAVCELSETVAELEQVINS